MDKEKSIEEIISSIYNLINEAKEEYEKILKDDFKSIQNRKNIITKKNHLEAGFNRKHPDNESLYEQKENIKINEQLHYSNWKEINFTEKNSNSQNNKEEIKIEIVKKRFNELMQVWIDKNLKKIIELEFSNQIKNKKTKIF